MKVLHRGCVCRTGKLDLRRESTEYGPSSILVFFCLFFCLLMRLKMVLWEAIQTWNRIEKKNWYLLIHCKFLPRENYGVLTASITLEVKNIHAHDTIRLFNNFNEINFSVGCMVWLWCCLLKEGLPVKILMR